jgi:4-alpha-glucanotransferase
VAGPGGVREAEQRWILVPQRCSEVAERLDEPRAFGLWSNLYSLRSRRGGPVGDLGELRLLVEAAAEMGAAFVGINPLHALWNRGRDISPYCPVSRLYRSALYLDLDAIPEFAESGARVEALRRGLGGGEGALDYAAASAAKQAVLIVLHRRFVATHRGRETERGRAYAAYRAQEGEALADFATFLAIAAELSEPASAGGPADAQDWREWPAAYRSPRESQVANFREEKAEAVDFHCWQQFELDRQLEEAAREARCRGVALGLYGDLAVGSAASGSDAWSFPGLFADGATAGAPPDDFSNEGQSWGFPPLDPRALRRSGYAYWIRLLRCAFAHMGALRIDHIMGLSRLFWVPRGHSAREGAYVRYPERELIGILALESRRHAAIVIGEDLGTVPRGFPSRLARRGILSSRVLTFEREGSGFRAAQRYSKRALVSTHTHDLVPMAGYLRGRDLELRRQIGQIADEVDLEAAKSERELVVRALLRRLVAEGVLDSADPPPAPEQLVAALYAFLARTPCPLVAVSLDDMAGEEEPVNLPGVDPERYPSWTKAMTVRIEDLASNPIARAILEALRSRACSQGPPSSPLS